MPPVLFIPFIIASYTVPYVFDQPDYVSWGAVDAVYLIDMDVSRQRWDSMNGPELHPSEQMTYVGMVGATIMPLLDIPQPWDFVAYFVISSFTYTVWADAVQ